jgi:integrase
VMSAIGRVKPYAVTVAGVEAVYPVGHYELRSCAGSKIVWTRVTGGATEALEELRSAQKKANVVVLAKDAGVQVVLDPKRVALRDAAKKFVQAAKDRQAYEAAEIYERTLDDFLPGSDKAYADELKKEDVTKFHGQMRKRGLSDRTVHNRHKNLKSFLLYLGLNAKVIAGKAPKFEKTMPEIFEPEDLAAFFTSLTTDYDKLLFGLLLKTGLREREAMHLEWTDISSARRTLQVRSKPRYKHKIKDSEERELPLSQELIAELEAYRKQIPAEHRLVFGKRGGKEDAPDGHLLRRLKLLVKEAGLNCNACETCVASKECENWFLHKFRATYCTTMLRATQGDLRTVMGLMGHADLASTMRYLRPASTSQVQDRVNAVTRY